jgi:hypothetical protein
MTIFKPADLHDSQIAAGKSHLHKRGREDSVLNLQDTIMLNYFIAALMSSYDVSVGLSHQAQEEE